MKIKRLHTFENTSKSEWHDWFAWYPVYSVEYGWVWLRWLHRKEIPADYKDRAVYKEVSAILCEKLTNCWHRIPDHAP